MSGFGREDRPQRHEPAESGRAMSARTPSFPPEGAAPRPGELPPAHPPAGEAPCIRPDLRARLSEWAELPPAELGELEAHAAQCAECGPGLELLKEAEAWLAGDALGAVGLNCPSPEELYDYGRGPGASSLPDAERLALRAHLGACSECSSLVDSLASRPPAPLLFDGAPTGLQRANHFRRRLRWAIPLAAAAALALVLLAIRDTKTPQVALASAEIRFPTEPVLRGADDSALLFPRDALLVGDNGTWSQLAFELAPREHAARYSIQLRRNDGSAFDGGEPLLRLDGPAPRLEATSLVALEPGHYTWEAWAEVDGLNVPLGERDFEARREPALVAELTLALGSDEPLRSETVLNLLHLHGFAGDARDYARRLPPSPARDAYLSAKPGR